MRNRISQTTVEMRDSSGKHFNIEYLRPVSINGRHVYLDMIKKRHETEKEKISVFQPDDENCNKARVYHSAKNQENEQKLFLLTVRDPGLYPICIGLFAILILMIWYFYCPNLNGQKFIHWRKNKKGLHQI